MILKHFIQIFILRIQSRSVQLIEKIHFNSFTFFLISNFNILHQSDTTLLFILLFYYLITAFSQSLRLKIFFQFSQYFCFIIIIIINKIPAIILRVFITEPCLIIGWQNTPVFHKKRSKRFIKSIKIKIICVAENYPDLSCNTFWGKIIN